jgi:diguanylate cyclase (GGDEF)-like protein
LRLKAWLGFLADHQLAVVVNSSGQLIYTPNNRDIANSRLISATLPKLQAIAGYLYNKKAELPDGIVQLIGKDHSAGRLTIRSSVFLQKIDKQLCIISAVPIGQADDSTADSDDSQLPIAMTVRVIDQKQLADIGSRLQLMDLRMVDGNTQSGDNVYRFVDNHNNSVARFEWRPQKPGAEILGSVIPFIAVAFGGFAILAGLIFLYMRNTAATIVAGENRLRHLALHDPLCGLPNRNFFSERLEAVIANIKDGGPPAATFYIDLDHFKDVNDTLGHPIGDELIRNVTSRLSSMMRGDDLVARLGGDEFAIIVSGISDPNLLLAVGRRIIAKLCAPYLIDVHTITIGASIGIAAIDQRSGATAADIMRYADMALYRAKNEGRNRACMYDSVMDADLSQRKLIEKELREAIESDALKVLYQPFVNPAGDKIIGVEALARWPHPIRGMVSPAEFIPIAEHSGLIVDLGTRVLRRACLDAKGWPGINVAVNVSPVQFRQPNFVSVVEKILTETLLEPYRLELEITESTFLGNIEDAETVMRQLKGLGVNLALDDFGTGYSSLLYLRRFPFDKLKIDRSFVLSIEKASDAAAIVHAIVSLGRGLGMKVTAEGVESAEQHLFLRAAGVHCIQGFRFGRPSEPEDITARLANPAAYRCIDSDVRASLAS